MIDVLGKKYSILQKAFSKALLSIAHLHNRYDSCMGGGGSRESSSCSSPLAHIFDSKTRVCDSRNVVSMVEMYVAVQNIAQYQYQ